MPKYNLIKGQKTLTTRKDTCESVVKLLFGSDSKEGPKIFYFRLHQNKLLTFE
jgi:hypothetical protein